MARSKIKRKEVTDIVGELVAMLTPTFTITNNVDNGNGTYTLDTCNTYWLRPPCNVTINSIVYKITEFVQDTSITIKGASQPVVTSFVIPAPYYIHGTWLAAQNELIRLESSIKFPLVYLREVISEVFDNTVGSSKDRDADLEMFFLDIANFDDFKTDDHYTYVIKPMTSMQQEFIELIDNKNGIQRFDNYTVMKHAKFGTVNQDGHEKYLFNDTTSGVELRINIPISVTLGCKNC